MDNKMLSQIELSNLKLKRSLTLCMNKNWIKYMKNKNNRANVNAMFVFSEILRIYSFENIRIKQIYLKKK